MGSFSSSWQIGHEFPASTTSSLEGGEPYCYEEKNRDEFGWLISNSFLMFFNPKINRESNNVALIFESVHEILSVTIYNK